MDHAETHLNESGREALRRMVARIERLEEEKAGLAADVRDVYKEAKAGGFDVKAMRKLIRARKKSRREREQEEAILDLYAAAVEPS